MRNMVATVIVFGVIFILILGAAFFFQKMHGLDTLKSADEAIDRNVRSLMERTENFSSEQNAAKDPVIGSKDNISGGSMESVPEENKNVSAGSSTEEGIKSENPTSGEGRVLPANVGRDMDMKTPDHKNYENDGPNVTPEDKSREGDISLQNGFNLYEKLKTAVENSGENFRELAEEDPFGKSVKNLGEIIKQNADNISEKFFNNPIDKEGR